MFPYLSIIFGCVFHIFSPSLVISQVEKASTSSAQLPELGDNATALIRELQEATPLSLGFYNADDWMQLDVDVGSLTFINIDFT